MSLLYPTKPLSNMSYLREAREIAQACASYGYRTNLQNACDKLHTAILAFEVDASTETMQELNARWACVARAKLACIPPARDPNGGRLPQGATLQTAA